jgi:DNA repair exonuclease SbcCD nuclease subunit
MEQPNKRDCLYDVDVDVNRINVLLIHADVLEKDSGALRVDLNRISGKFDYVALGHVHQYAEIRDRIIYPGTPEPLDFTEKGQHGVVYGRLGKDNFEKMFVPVAKSRFITKEIFLQPEFSSEKILDIIKYSGDYISASKDYFKIILTGSVNSGIDMDRLLNEASNYFQHIGFEENYLYDIHSDQLPERQEDSLIGQYIKQYQEKGLKTLEMQKSFLLGLNLLMESKERSDDH